jgi:hypothetical protein
MADYALFIGWGEVVAGREKRALDVFNEVMQYYSRLQQEGIVESVEPCLLEPHGGELYGFILLKGDREKLSRLRVDPEFDRMTARASLCVRSIGVVGALTGNAVATEMAMFSEEIARLEPAGVR